MGLMTATELLAHAEAAGISNPRVIFRKRADGNVALVLKHGSSEQRYEVIFDRRATVAETKAALADVKPE